MIQSDSSRTTKYAAIIPQIKALVGSETDRNANAANVSAALFEEFDWLWVGFYFVNDDELVLGPFQGPVACTRIKKGTGVSGDSWQQKEIVVVDNVDLYPGHIACSAKSKSEIVVPIIKDGVVIGVLDADSENLASFNEIDSLYLGELCDWLSTIL